MLRTKDSPAPAAGRLSVDLCLQIVAGFTRVACSAGDYTEVLGTLGRFLCAEAVMLERIGRIGEEPVVLAQHYQGRDKYPASPEPTGVAQILLAQSGVRPRPGSIWMMSEVLDYEQRSALAPLLDGTPRIRDVVIVPLDAGQHVLELQFTGILQDHNRVLLASLASMLSAIWSERGGDGTAARPKIHEVRGTVARARILSDENPLGLTRSEYRICLLIRDGYRAQDIAEAQHVAESTVRSHLRSIYQKAEVKGQMALLHRLSTERPPGRMAG